MSISVSHTCLHLCNLAVWRFNHVGYTWPVLIERTLWISLQARRYDSGSGSWLVCITTFVYLGRLADLMALFACLQYASKGCTRCIVCDSRLPSPGEQGGSHSSRTAFPAWPAINRNVLSNLHVTPGYSYQRRKNYFDSKKGPLKPSCDIWLRISGEEEGFQCG